ncbi:MAG: hypothetical protein R2698_11255 [Microthrixaceae bacterium]
MADGPRIGERLFRGYGPLIGFAAMFTAMAVFVPTVSTEVRTVSAPSEPYVTSTAPGGSTTTTLSGDPAQPPPSTGDPAVPGAAPAQCEGRQVKGDVYSPPCRRSDGKNPGATSKGVTGDTITVAVRLNSFKSGLTDAIAQAAGAKMQGENEGTIRRTISGLFDFFNKYYEFYGRKLKPVIYDGRGDVLKELLGSGVEGAQNDALKVGQEIKAFADVSAITPPYIDGLVQQKVIAIGAPYMSRKWMSARDPFVWSPLVDCSSIAENMSTYYLRRMAGKAARNAGGDLAGRQRKLGIIVPNSSWYQECLDDGLAALKKGGVVPASVQT